MARYTIENPFRPHEVILAGIPRKIILRNSVLGKPLDKYRKEYREKSLKEFQNKSFKESRDDSWKQFLKIPGTIPAEKLGGIAGAIYVRILEYSLQKSQEQSPRESERNSWKNLVRNLKRNLLRNLQRILGDYSKRVFLKNFREKFLKHPWDVREEQIKVTRRKSVKECLKIARQNAKNKWKEPQEKSPK